MPDASSIEQPLSLIPDLDLDWDGRGLQAAGADIPVAVINLPHRTDRWAAISGRLAAAGINNLIKVPAVVGAGLSLPEISALLGLQIDVIEAPPRSHLTLTRPAIGCFLSHLAIWKWLIVSKLPGILIFEDDAYPATNFDPTRFCNTLTAMPRGAGILFLGRIIMNGLAEESPVGELARLYYFNGTFAYLITPAACRFLIPRLLPMRAHIDHEISRVLVECRHEFSAYSVEPPLFEPDWSLQSDCYVPLEEETDADRALGALLTKTRNLLLHEGRPLLAPFR